MSYAGEVFSKNYVREGISLLKASIGMDGIHSNHLKISSELLVELLSRLLSCFVTHGYTPHNMISGTINPTVKDRYGDLSSSDNYRPVMSSSVILKLFEYCLLKKISPYVKINDRKHRFRPNHSTGTACMFFKETVMN